MARGIARDHAEKRVALRKGSAVYFARHGFDRASMAGAADHCGVSKALIYHYYDSKEALLFDILEAHLSHLVEVSEIAATQSLGWLVTAILEAYADGDAEHKLQLEALDSLPEDLRAPLVALQRRLVRVMCDSIRTEAPELEGDRLRAAAMTVFGILNWVYMWHRPGHGLSRADYARLAVRFVRGGLTALSDPPQG